MTSQLNVALVRLRVLYVLIFLAYILTCCSCIFVQPGTFRRSVDWCMNIISVLYLTPRWKDYELFPTAIHYSIDI